MNYRHGRPQPGREPVTAVTAKTYLEYLDKEMTIMGILSTFCVGVIALVVDRIGSAEFGKYTLFRTARESHYWFITAGSAWLLLAAGLFYMQRSHLAWIYGRISVSIEGTTISGYTMEEWLREANTWRIWIPYRAAFSCLALGFAAYGIAFVGAATQRTLPYAWLWLPPALVWIIQAPRFVILWNSDSETPLRDFLQSVFSRKKIQSD